MKIIDLINRNIHGLSIEELETLLSYYENHEESHKYEFKIKQIKRVVRHKGRPEKKDWIKLAEEDRETKKKWLELGATWVCRESMTEWYYKGKPFYKWFSGVNVNEEIHRLRKSDKKLMGLIENENTIYHQQTPQRQHKQ